MPRKILTLYDSHYEKTPELTLAHKICEMPLNYLGLDLVYHDLQEPLPDLSKDPEIRGILTCFPHAMAMQDPIAFLQWAEGALDLGKKYVIVRDPGFKVGPDNTFTPDFLVNSFYQKLGIFDHMNWVQYTFHYNILAKESALVEFEHIYPSPFLPFSTVEIIDPKMHSFLTVGLAGDASSITQLVIAGSNGGYIAEYYGSTFTIEEQAPEARYWYVDPFKFFRIAFGVEENPVPDVTTLAGRRILQPDRWGLF